MKFDLISPLALRRLGILGMNRRNVAYIARYNPRSRFPLVDDKVKTKLVAEKMGLTAPKLLHVISTQHEVEDIDQVLSTLKQFVVKPAQGSGGKGILVIRGRSEAGFVKASGDTITLEGIKRHVTNIISGLHSLGGRPDEVIIETLIEVSPIFEDFSFEGVPDIRLIVFKGFPVMGMLRLATHQSDGKANLHQGAVGVGLDIGSGRAIAAVQSNKLVTVHPDTGAELVRVKVPNWRQLLVLAASCHEATGLGYLGCDIVIDQEHGPMLLELNARPGLSIQIANNEGLLPRLRRIEALETPYMAVEDRVDYSMQWFSREPVIQQQLFEEPA